MLAIEAKQLVKDFNHLRAVDGVTFTVEEGELFGFLGPNGAGKTTTINILCTLLLPTSGRAFVAGLDVLSRPQHVRRAIGIIFQDPTLDERLTAYENLNFHGMIYHLPAKLRKKRIGEMLEFMGLADRRSDLVRNFSGGMKRRLEVARGLLHEPRVLFLDEPTLGLDPQTRNHIWDYLVNLRRATGITLFLTTHYMEEAENCDRVAVIDHGQIIAMDSPANLKRRLGGDIITIQTSDDLAVEKEVVEKYRLETSRDENGVHLKIPNASGFVPELIAGLQGRVKTVDLRKPTLNDVFLALTGREIREGSATDVDRLREVGRNRWRMR